MPGTEHILPRRTFMQAAATSLALQSAMVRAQDEYGNAALRGAGSTFVRPLMEAWVRRYREDPHMVMHVDRWPGGGLEDRLSSDYLDYEAVGSLAGIQRISNAAVDFAATEMPLQEDALRRHRLLQFPWVAGGVGVVAQGIPSGLQLDGPTLADIYLGRIVRWSDPRLASLNPGAALPDARIVVIHRSDGSGTTYTFARYLSGHSAEWRARIGADLTVPWRVGTGARGGEGIVAALRATPHSIGYVNAVEATQARLTLVSVRNPGGRFVSPTRAAVDAALTAQLGGDDAAQQVRIDAPGAASYPIVATVFGLLRGPSTAYRGRRAADFVRWTLSHGGSVVTRLGYSRLPDSEVQRVLQRLPAV